MATCGGATTNGGYRSSERWDFVVVIGLILTCGYDGNGDYFVFWLVDFGPGFSLVASG